MQFVSIPQIWPFRYWEPRSRIWDNYASFILAGVTPSRRNSSENRGTKDALALIVRGELIPPTQNRNRETLPTEIDKGLQLKKPDSVKTGRKKRVLLRSYLSQPLVELRNNRARHEIGMGIFWVVLAAVCGGLGWVLLTILLK
jgi:hypothetical protein